MMVRSRRTWKGEVRRCQHTDKRIRRRQDRWRKLFWLKRGATLDVKEYLEQVIELRSQKHLTAED